MGGNPGPPGGPRHHGVTRARVGGRGGGLGLRASGRNPGSSRRTARVHLPLQGGKLCRLKLPAGRGPGSPTPSGLPLATPGLEPVREACSGTACERLWARSLRGGEAPPPPAPPLGHTPSPQGPRPAEHPRQPRPHKLQGCRRVTSALVYCHEQLSSALTFTLQFSFGKINRDKRTFRACSVEPRLTP